MSERTCHTTKIVSDNLLAKKKKKTRTLINKPVYLRVSILEISNV